MSAFYATVKRMAGQSRDLRHQELLVLGEPPRLASQQPETGMTAEPGAASFSQGTDGS